MNRLKTAMKAHTQIHQCDGLQRISQKAAAVKSVSNRATYAWDLTKSPIQSLAGSGVESVTVLDPERAVKSEGDAEDGLGQG